MATATETNPTPTEELYGDRDWTGLVRLAERLTWAPYSYTEAQITKATEALQAGRVRLGVPRDNVAYVTSSTNAKQTYTVVGDKPCPCRATKPCYHPCAAELYRLWEEHMHPPSLFPAPKTVDERLAASPTPKETPADTTAMPLEGTEVAHQDTIPAEMTTNTPLEPEAILEPPRHLEMPSTALVPVEAAPLTAVALGASLAEWAAQRKVISRYIQEQFVVGLDYGRVHFASKSKCPQGPTKCRNEEHWSKDTLFKPGAEKFTHLFRLTPTFHKDTDTWEMLGSPAGTLCYVCELRTASGEVVGEGRGARAVKDDYDDINKTIKMAQKSAQIDAVLRTGALSDAFTQDLDDTVADNVRQAGAMQAQWEELMQEIITLVRARGKDLDRAWAFAEQQYGCPRAQLSLAHLQDFKARILHAQQTAAAV